MIEMQLLIPVFILSLANTWLRQDWYCWTSSRYCPGKYAVIGLWKVETFINKENLIVVKPAYWSYI